MLFGNLQFSMSIIAKKVYPNLVPWVIRENKTTCSLNDKGI
jgi:hypothetical protein